MKIQNYIKKKNELVLIHGRISETLYKELSQYMKENKLKWSQIMEASLQALMDEVKKTK